MANLKSLAKDTAIYGLSSIVGRFLNYLMVPLYTYTLKSCSDYGIYNDIYAQTALLIGLIKPKISRRNTAVSEPTVAKAVEKTVSD